MGAEIFMGYREIIAWIAETSLVYRGQTIPSWVTQCRKSLWKKSVVTKQLVSMRRSRRRCR